MNDRIEKAPAHALVRPIVIRNPLGLHARAAAKFVKAASAFDAEITVVRDDLSVSGKSILGLMMLGAGPGTELKLRAQGPDAARALEALAALVSDGFGED